MPNIVINYKKPKFSIKELGIVNIVWCILVVLTSTYLYFHWFLNNYEIVIQLAYTTLIILFGLYWKQIRIFATCALFLFSLANWYYNNNINNNELNFLLKYLLSSQPSFIWMGILYIVSTVLYWGFFLRKSVTLGKYATVFTWIATLFGTSGLLIRWRESYLVSEEIGHIPLSNMYEVTILFFLITTLIYLFYEEHLNIRAIGCFIMSLISVAVIFTFWYAFYQDAYHIRPLMPALRSFWIQLHVPVNFVGYGAFSIAAMSGLAIIIKEILTSNNSSKQFLPSKICLEEVMYRAISLGFSAFTIATILGAFWAAEAWGSYWSWDPKETWALAVLLNYAAWLHLKISRGYSSLLMAWWAFLSLFITIFAFLGVNLLQSGLHSYGSL